MDFSLPPDHDDDDGGGGDGAKITRMMRMMLVVAEIQKAVNGVNTLCFFFYNFRRFHVFCLLSFLRQNNVFVLICTLFACLGGGCGSLFVVDFPFYLL